MKRLAMILLAVPLLMGQEKKALPEVYREKIRRIEAEIKLLEVQAKALTDERVAAWTAACQAAGIEKLAECNIDRSDWTIWAEKPAAIQK